MKNWKRILAAVGTTALLVSNLGAVSQVTFAAEETPAIEEIPAEGSDAVPAEEPAATTAPVPELQAETESAEIPEDTEVETTEPESEEAGQAEETASDASTETLPETDSAGVDSEQNATDTATEGAGVDTGSDETASDEATVETPAEEEQGPAEQESTVENAEEEPAEETVRYHESPLMAEMEDAGIAVQLVFDDAAEIPEDATLSLHRITDDSADYQEYYAGAQKALGTEDGSVVYADFVEIIATDGDGEAVTPAAAVKATITYNDRVVVPVGTRLSVICGSDVLRAAVESEGVEDENVAVQTVTFDLSGNAVYGIVGVQTETEEALVDRTIEASAPDGASVKISGMLPAEAAATMEPVTLSDEELRAYFGDSFIDGINTIGLYDISIWNDDKEWEPDDTVSVVISNPVVKPVNDDAEEILEATDEENIVIAHLQEDAASGERTAETLESATIGDNVAFDTESFSIYGAITYTVDYYYGDAEYHMAGGTSMLLSELFDRLEIDASAADVTEVTFTNYDLLGVTQVENDWQLTSLAPFNTDEELTITFADGSQIKVLTQDVQYFKYTYDSNYLRPYTGTYTKVGKYDVFGGGNGLAIVTSNQGSDSKNGAWGKTHTYSEIRNNTIDEYGNQSKRSDDRFVSSSVGEISWADGAGLDKAFFSFGYFASARGTITLQIKKDTISTTVEINLSQSQIQEDSRTDTTGALRDWRFLSFDATDLVKAGGTGNYEVTATLSGLNDSDTVADMGWSIYGVVKDTSLDKDAAVLVYVTEKEVINSTGTHNNPSYREVNAEGTFTQDIVVNKSGKGKAWFNVHGGESREQDYLKLHVKSDTSDEYIKLGSTYYSREKTIALQSVKNSGTYFDADDIAKPNNEQTAPSGYTAFSNRFAFGLGQFEDTDLGLMTITGLQKSMEQGEWNSDILGSLMLWTEIEKAEGVVNYQNNIQVASGATAPQAETFTYTLTGKNGTSVYPTNGRSYTLQFNLDELTDGANKDDSIEFTFDQEGTFTYELSQSPGSTPGWTYAREKYTVVFKVEYDTTKAAYVVESKTITDANGVACDTATFTNVYAPIVKTGVDLGDNTFPGIILAVDAMVVMFLAYGFVKRRIRQ